MRLQLSVFPAAACAAAMFLCFRMMRHSDMPADGHAEGDDLGALRKEVADLRQELARARSVPSGAAADGLRQIVRRSSETATDPRPSSPPTPADTASATGHPDG